MKKIILLISVILFCSCHSQKKMSIRQMNEYLLNNNQVNFGSLDSTELKGMKNALTKYRLLAAQSCNINSNKKYSQIYIEDGFQDEEGFYEGIIITNNNDVCKMTNNLHKLKTDSLSYTKTEEGNFVLFTKKISIENLKKQSLDEYYRYQLVIQNKVNNLKKCLITDEYIPKPSIYAKNYYFSSGKIHSYGTIRIKYSEIKDGINGEIPYLKKDKEKAFLECINSLNIK